MGAKTIFIIVITVLVTIILMNNTAKVTFWAFGNIEVSMIIIFGVLFSLGFLLGFLARGKRKRLEQALTIERSHLDSQANRSYLDSSEDGYSDEEYIK